MMSPWKWKNLFYSWCLINIKTQLTDLTMEADLDSPLNIFLLRVRTRADNEPVVPAWFNITPIGVCQKRHRAVHSIAAIKVNVKIDN